MLTGEWMMAMISFVLVFIMYGVVHPHCHYCYHHRHHHHHYHLFHMHSSSLIPLLVVCFPISSSAAANADLYYGVTLTLIGSFVWTFHILLTDFATNRVDTLQLTLVQLLGTSVLSFLASYNFEFNEWNR